jgi:hypothetical protein
MKEKRFHLSTAIPLIHFPLRTLPSL